MCLSPLWKITEKKRKSLLHGRRHYLIWRPNLNCSLETCCYWTIERTMHVTHHGTVLTRTLRKSHERENIWRNTAMGKIAANQSRPFVLLKIRPRLEDY